MTSEMLGTECWERSVHTAGPPSSDVMPVPRKEPRV